MKKLYEMMQDRANVATQMREIMNKFEDGVMDAESTETYNRLEKEFDALNANLILANRSSSSGNAPPVK